MTTTPIAHLHDRRPAPGPLAATAAVPATRPPAPGPIEVWFGPARPEDAADLHSFYEALSPESRRRRFFQPMPRVPRSMATHLSSVDPDRHAVWLARAGSPGGEVVGEVQVATEADDPTRGELAVAVADDWTGRGLGRALVELAHELAARLGVETLTAEVLADNRRCVDLLTRAGLRFTVSSGLLTGAGPVVATGRIPASTVVRPRVDRASEPIPA